MANICGELIVVDIPKSDRVPDVAVRLNNRSRSGPDAWDIIEKHRKAEGRLEDSLSPSKAIKHNQKVQQAGIKAVLNIQERRNTVEDAIKTKLEAADTKRRISYDDVRYRISKEEQKREEGLLQARQAEEQRKEALLARIQSNQVTAAEKRHEHIKATKDRAAKFGKRLKEGRERMEETDVVKAAERAEALEECIRTAEERRAAYQAEQAAKLAKAQAQVQAVQRRNAKLAAAKAQAVETKLQTAEINRKLSIEEVKAKAALAAAGRHATSDALPIGTNTTPEAVTKEKLEARVAAAEERRTRRLSETAEKAAAVVKKQQEAAAIKAAADERAAKEARATLEEKEREARSRYEAALQAKQEGLSKYLETLNISNSCSVSRTCSQDNNAAAANADDAASGN